MGGIQKMSCSLFSSPFFKIQRQSPCSMVISIVYFNTKRFHVKLFYKEKNLNEQIWGRDKKNPCKSRVLGL